MSEPDQLRGRWIPRTEVETRRAHSEGLLEEGPYLDVKREIGDSPSAKLELARDMASFAVEGGTLIVGVDEAPDDGEHFKPFVLRQQAERVEQIALSRIDPPLAVRCFAVPSDADPGVGYLVIHIPRSPLAPHQVDGRYWARNDKTKRQLNDPEVELLIRRREQWARGAADDLDALVVADPLTAEQSYPHLFVVARPAAADDELCAVLVGVPAWQAHIRGLIAAVEQDPEHRGALAATGGDLTTDLPDHLTQKLATGARFTTTPPDSPNEEYTKTLDVLENGLVRFYSSHVGHPSTFNGSVFTRLWTEQVCASTRSIIVLTNYVSAAVRFVGAWDFGVALTGMLDARPMPSSAQPQVMSPVGFAFTDAMYRRTTRATTVECESSPGSVLDRLIRPLLSGLGAFDQAAPLRSGPPHGSDL